jgi:hypothetical protein
MPGRLISAVRKAGCRDPLLLLDEVDKMGHDHRWGRAVLLGWGGRMSCCAAGMCNGHVGMTGLAGSRGSVHVAARSRCLRVVWQLQMLTHRQVLLICAAVSWR